MLLGDFPCKKDGKQNAMTPKKKLIEVTLPLHAINVASAHDEI